MTKNRSIESTEKLDYLFIYFKVNHWR